jgi:hypothetical protein
VRSVAVLGFFVFLECLGLFLWAVEADDAGYQKNRARAQGCSTTFITLEIYERYRHVHKYAQSIL